MANKNFKGRPKGSNKVIITDPSLGKYYISQDEWSFNLIRKNAIVKPLWVTMGNYHTL